MITKYEKYCSLCGSPATEVHHLVLGTSLRKLAEQDDLKMPLCNNCHDVYTEATSRQTHFQEYADSFYLRKILLRKKG